jgi:basic membrane protein A and related proteins
MPRSSRPRGPLPVRALALVVAVSAAFAAACKVKPHEGAAGKEPARRAQAPEKRLPLPAPGKWNAAFVYVGPVGDGGWTWAHDLGRRHLEQKLGVHTAYVESVAEGAEAEQVVRGLARKGFDLVVGASFGYMDAMQAVAAEFPSVRFVHIAGYKENGKNFGNLFGAMECMKFLSGLIAGARAEADGNPRLGYIAPFPIPEVIRLGNAVMLGARQSCPRCTMDIRWINSWFDPSREREAAESLIKAGAQVVVTGADTPGPIVAAKDAARWAIGYDSKNACRVAPERCLTTPYWDWGPVYVEMVTRMRAGKWRGSSEYLDVSSGIVGLHGFMEGDAVPAGVPAAVVPRVKELLARMRAGSFTRFDVFQAPLVDNRGRVVLEAGRRLDQKDLEGLPGCKVCMGWLAQGITGQIPAR